MLELDPIAVAEWRRIAHSEGLADEITCTHLKALETDSQHCMPVPLWARKLLAHNRKLYAQRRPPDTPSVLQPGTDAKVQEMIDRVEQGRSPFHEQDRHVRDFEGGTEHDRKALLPEKIANGANWCSVTSATHTAQGVVPCALTAN